MVEQHGASTSLGFAAGRLVAGSELREFDSRKDATDVARGVTELVGAADGRQGLGLGGLGTPAQGIRFFVDGLPEPLLRHPGVPGEPAASPLFSRDILDQAEILQTGTDAEWRGALGSLLSIQTRRGSDRLSFQPWIRGSSAKLGGNSALNPADSSGMSFSGGAVLSGSLVPDTARFVLQGEYHSLETPSAFPLAGDSGRYQGADVSIRETVTGISADSFGTPAAATVQPVVRTWKGGTISGRLDWLVSPRHGLVARAGFATWKERSPLLGLDAGNDAGSQLEARDLSGAVAITSSGETTANELRAGVHATRREWRGNNLPASFLANEGLRFGGSASLPGLFDQKGLKLSDAFQFSLGRHALKVGGSLDYTNYTHTWAYGSAGVFLIGDLDEFGAGRGTYFQAMGVGSGAKFSLTDVGLFAEDVFSIAPEVQLLLGLRYETQMVPGNKLALDPLWLILTGLRTDVAPEDRSAFSPRVGFVWDVRNRGELMVRGGAGLFYGSLDPAQFAEAVLGSTGLRTLRDQGDLGWPVPVATPLRQELPRLALFEQDYKAPRTFKAELGFTRSLTSGWSFSVGGGYYHGDYLIRRLDLNRVGTSIADTDEGRPVYGVLVKQGGLLSAEPGSNRRFTPFDLVSGFVTTGFSDHYEVTASAERRISSGLALIGSYTFSRTRDNRVGLLAPDPMDQLSPFPETLNGVDWDEGRSDLDIPHRVAATLEYRTRGATPVILNARWRWRSGLPFTPGFRAGVDPNADGGGNNDPAFLDAGIADLATYYGQASCTQSVSNQFAERNSCREQAVHGLDLGVRLTLPVAVGEGRRLSLEVDALNVAASTTGVIDRALVLVDPAAVLVP
ncbi:MAG TPA: hypothetical protein VFN96_05565, partial [Gemmatimonadales bacterium]|nr:hypothetical protein [Gemmatimonadales bacterium]